MKNAPHSLGLLLGALFAVVHVVWSILVAAGLAQPLLQTSLKLHMISMPVQILPFSWGSAVLLVIFTAVMGYVIGFVAGTIWQMMEKR